MKTIKFELPTTFVVELSEESKGKQAMVTGLRKWCIGWLSVGLGLLCCSHGRNYRVQLVEQLPANQWPFLATCAKQQQHHTLEQTNQLVVWSQANHWLLLTRQAAEHTIQATLFLDATSDPLAWHEALQQDQQTLQNLLGCSGERVMLIQAVAGPTSGLGEPNKQVASETLLNKPLSDPTSLPTSTPAAPANTPMYMDGAIPSQPPAEQVMTPTSAQPSVRCQRPPWAIGLVCQLEYEPNKDEASGD